MNGESKTIWKIKNHTFISRRIYTIIILLLMCAYALWQKLELFSIVVVFLLVCFIYKDTSKEYLETTFNLLKNTKKAKIGNIEVELKEIRDITEATWMHVIASKLEAKHVSLLFNIRSGEYKNNPSAIRRMITELRYLRQLGLIRHASSTLSVSETVYLSDLGEMIIDYLEPIKESSLHQ